MWKIITRKVESKNRILLIIIIFLLSVCLFYLIDSQRQLSRIQIDKTIRLAIIEHEKREEQNLISKNRTKCRSRLPGLQKRWNNIIGVRYAAEEDVCMVKYSINNGEDTEEAPVEEMRDI